MSPHGRRDPVSWYPPTSSPSTSSGVGGTYLRIPTSDQSELSVAPTYQTYPPTDVDPFCSNASADESMYFDHMYPAQPQSQQLSDAELASTQLAGSTDWNLPSTTTSTSTSYPTTQQTLSTTSWQTATLNGFAATFDTNGWSKDYYTPPNDFPVGNPATFGLLDTSNTRSNGPDPPFGSPAFNTAVGSGLDNNRAVPWGSQTGSVASPSAAMSAVPAPVAATPPFFDVSQPTTPQLKAGSRLLGNKPTKSQRPVKELETEARAKNKRDGAWVSFNKELSKCVGHEPKAGHANQLAMATQVLSEHLEIKAERDFMKTEIDRLSVENEAMRKVLHIARINNGRNVPEIMMAFPALASV